MCNVDSPGIGALSFFCAFGCNYKILLFLSTSQNPAHRSRASFFPIFFWLPKPVNKQPLISGLPIALRFCPSLLVFLMQILSIRMQIIPHKWGMILIFKKLYYLHKYVVGCLFKRGHDILMLFLSGISKSYFRATAYERTTCKCNPSRSALVRVIRFLLGIDWLFFYLNSIRKLQRHEI